MKTLTYRLAVAVLAAGFAGSGLRAESTPPATAAQVDKIAGQLKNVDDRAGSILDAIKNKADEQTQTLAQIKGEVDQVHSDYGNLDARMPDGTFPIKLPEINNSLERLDGLLQRIGADVKAAMAAQTSAAASSTAKLAQISDSVARVEKNGAALDADFAQLRKDLASDVGRAEPAPQRAASPWTPVLASAGLFAFLAAVAAGLAGRAQRRREDASRESVSAQIAQARDQIQAAVNASLKDSSSELGRTLTGREKTNDDILAEVQRLVGKVEQLGNAEKERKAAVDPLSVPFDERPTLKGFVPAGPSIASAALWPPAFLDPSAPISRWREMLESHIGSSRRSALPVLAAWLAVRAAAEKPDASMLETGDAVAAFSGACYDYWEGTQEIDADDLQRANSDWANALRSYLAPVAPKLEIREIVPGVRFDSTLMQTVKEGAGNRLNVAAVHSWAILDRSVERTKVLNRARVTTT